MRNAVGPQILAQLVGDTEFGGFCAMGKSRRAGRDNGSFVHFWCALSAGTDNVAR